MRAEAGEGSTMNDWSKAFYTSQAWADCRRAYRKSQGGLCEVCRAKGIAEPATEVHHVIHLSPRNIDNPEITLNWGNLRAVCHACHVEEHRSKKRWKVDENGSVKF